MSIPHCWEFGYTVRGDEDQQNRNLWFTWIWRSIFGFCLNVLFSPFKVDFHLHSHSRAPFYNNDFTPEVYTRLHLTCEFDSEITLNICESPPGYFSYSFYKFTLDYIPTPDLTRVLTHQKCLGYWHPNLLAEMDICWRWR